MLTRNVRDLLPIGSVVLLKGAEKRLMIFGIRQTNQDSAREYDYVGVLYPEGNMGEQVRFMFDQDDVQSVVFRGYDDQERSEFLVRLNAYYEQKGNSPEA